ncbi:hypothetical protein E2C01_062395 [Portunus trituberculatus]|uniref:Uncharacterized protein n=1 Tax=Portunus trituberculatus TaxID=210409 RepID=A0A5B7HH67_PORTR|nr:hypothetical protein [Portunus trituberculatus]
MADQEDAGPARSSPSSASGYVHKKRRDVEPSGKDSKKRKDCHEGRRGQSRSDISDLPSPAGPSDVSATPVQAPPTEDKFDCISALLTGLMERLDKDAGPASSASGPPDFAGFQEVSSSEREDGECPEDDPDPLDELDLLNVAPDEDDSDFSRALKELLGHFHGEEKGELLAECLASILDSSLQRRPTPDGIKLTCDKIKLPSNVPNLAVPVTNAAVTKATSVGGRLVDAHLFYANGLLCKALVPVVQCISDIGEKKGKPLYGYLDGLNNSLRLMTSVVNYLNHLRKEVACLHMHGPAMTNLCKWECEVGRDELFPFDLVKKCEEIHKMRKLGRPVFHPFQNRRLATSR